VLRQLQIEDIRTSLHVKAAQDVRLYPQAREWSRHLYARCRSRVGLILSMNRVSGSIISILTASSAYHWNLMLELVYSNIATCTMQPTLILRRCWWRLNDDHRSDGAGFKHTGMRSRSRFRTQLCHALLSNVVQNRYSGSSAYLVLTPSSCLLDVSYLLTAGRHAHLGAIESGRIREHRSPFSPSASNANSVTMVLR
jgi:hypothetical protein